MKNVVITLGRLDVGGAERRTLRLLEEIKRRNAPVSITMFVASGLPGALDDRFRATDVKIVYGSPTIRGLIGFFQLCRRAGTDVVHVNASLAGGFYCLAALAARVPVRISHIRSTAYNNSGLLFRLRNSVYRLFLNSFSTRVVGVCASARQLSRTPVRKWKTVYNGIDEVDRIGGRDTAGDASRLDILFLARLRPEKNPVRAVTISKALHAIAPERRIKLHFVGDETPETSGPVRTKVRELGLDDAVAFHGIADDPSAMLCHASVLLLTSIREGLPGVVLEALSCGTPVVASDLPGVREIAAACAGVTVIALSEPDEVWAEAVLAASAADREYIMRAFRGGPFNFEKHYDEMMQLWCLERRGGRRTLNRPLAHTEQP